MRTAINTAIAAILFALCVVNMVSNPFTTPAFGVEGCQGNPPGPECQCCQDCGCWVCP